MDTLIDYFDMDNESNHIHKMLGPGLFKVVDIIDAINMFREKHYKSVEQANN